MKKKLAIAIPIAVILLVLAAVGVYFTSLSNDITVNISKPDVKDDSSYISMFIISENVNFSKKSKADQIKQVSGDQADFYETFTKEHEKPYYIDVKYENIDKKTVITYKGEVTDKETGELVEFSKEFSYDFIITDKIIGDNGTSKYFN